MRIFAASMATISLAWSLPAAARLSPERAAIETAMADSAAGWNAGDLDRFMRVYSDAPDTSFVTRDGLIRGKAAMATRYRARYAFDKPGARGVLTFATLDFRLLGPRHALFIARYMLKMPNGTMQSGPTSLVFRREKGGWWIIADHSS